MSTRSIEAEADVATEGAGPAGFPSASGGRSGRRECFRSSWDSSGFSTRPCNFQPFMFRRDFVETFILPNASGQPAVVSWVITNIGHFIEPHIAL